MDGEKLSDLRFADDVAITTEDVKAMEHQKTKQIICTLLKIQIKPQGTN